MAVALLLALAAPASADSGDDTLRFFLSKYDLVVLGEITSQSVGISSEAGFVNYPCDFLVAEVLKGRKPGADSATRSEAESPQVFFRTSAEKLELIESRYSARLLNPQPTASQPLDSVRT
jgi:hypothetical protein